MMSFLSSALNLKRHLKHYKREIYGFGLDPLIDLMKEFVDTVFHLSLINSQLQDTNILQFCQTFKI
jgi:hypothetical protein